MTAYYNEFDRWPAARLQRLITHGRITPGHVDTRSIKDVQPAEIIEFERVHLFAGIGGWEEALRLAGWPEGCPVWTGSCPCQPFSSAGRGKGTADERHLWPEMFRLVDACRPGVVFGEQVASPDGLTWLDGVFDDLEGAGYTCRAADLCSAGIGAPHIRQRLYWMAYADVSGRQGYARQGKHVSSPQVHPMRTGNTSWMGDAIQPRLEGHAGHVDHGNQPGRIGAHQAGPVAKAGSDGRMAYAKGSGLAGWHRASRQDRPEVADDCIARRMEHADGGGQGRQRQRLRPDVGAGSAFAQGASAASPLDLDWSNVDWLLCRDGKWRPTQSGIFPLAHGISERVGRLRGYGNAIDPRVAAWFICSVMSEIFESEE